MSLKAKYVIFKKGKIWEKNALKKWIVLGYTDRSDNDLKAQII